jgi:hypothetical protein
MSARRAKNGSTKKRSVAPEPKGGACRASVILGPFSGEVKQNLAKGNKTREINLACRAIAADLDYADGAESTSANGTPRRKSWGGGGVAFGIFLVCPARPRVVGTRLRDVTGKQTLPSARPREIIDSRYGIADTGQHEDTHVFADGQLPAARCGGAANA